MIAANNPYNLRYSCHNNWKGQSGQLRGFCVFLDFDYATRAVAILLMRSYRMKYVRTYSQIIQRYAPPSENKTQVYIDFIISKLSKFPWDEPSTIYDFARLMYYIIWFEQGVKPEKVLNELNVIELIASVIRNYKILPYGLRR